MLMSDPERPAIVLDVTEPPGLLGNMKGLLGSAGVGEGKALLIRGRQVHTIGMRYTIDTVYLDSDGRVLRVRTLPPGRIGPLILSARCILELDAGEAERLGIREGSTLLPVA